MTTHISYTKYASVDELASVLMAHSVPLDDEHECRTALMLMGYGVVRPDRLDRIRLRAGMMEREERQAWSFTAAVGAGLGAALLSGPAHALELDAPLLSPAQGAIALTIVLAVALVLALWLAPPMTPPRGIYGDQINGDDR